MKILFSRRLSIRALPLLRWLARFAVLGAAACGASSGDLAAKGQNPVADAAASVWSADAGAHFVPISLDAGARSAVDAAVAVAPAIDAGGVSGASFDAAPNGCAPTTSTLLPRPAEALLVLDRSTTMAPLLADGTTKWGASVSAVAAAAASGRAAWGLMLFPKSGAQGDCCVMPASDDVPEVEVAPDVQSSATIGAALAGTAATGTGSPLARAVVQAGNYLSGRATSTSKYLVIVAADEPTCANDGLCTDAATTDDARTKDAVKNTASLQGIPVAVAVVGLAAANNSLQAAEQQLFFTDLAKLGGMPNTAASQPSYFPAASSSELAADLWAIAAEMRSCSFSLTGAVDWTSDAQVTLGDTRIPRDGSHQNGWDFGDAGSSIVLYGKPCADARSSASPASIQFTTSCPLAVL